MRGFRCQVESIFGPREHGMTCMLYLLPRRKTIPAWLSLTHGFRYFLRTEPPTFRSISTRRFLVRVDVICQIQMQKSKQSKSLDAETALNLHFSRVFWETNLVKEHRRIRNMLEAIESPGECQKSFGVVGGENQQMCLNVENSDGYWWPNEVTKVVCSFPGLIL